MSITDITNYMSVCEHIASSGQPEPHHFQQISEAGYQAVVNLAMPDSSLAITDEANIVESLGMRYIPIPVPFDAPTVQHLRQFIHVMETIGRQKVWIHCVLNYRVSAFLYQYHRIIQSWSEEQARKVILPSWQPDDVWQQFMTLTREEVMTGS